MRVRVTARFDHEIRDLGVHELGELHEHVWMADTPGREVCQFCSVTRPSFRVGDAPIVGTDPFLTAVAPDDAAIAQRYRERLTALMSGVIDLLNEAQAKHQMILTIAIGRDIVGRHVLQPIPITRSF